MRPGTLVLGFVTLLSLAGIGAAQTFDRIELGDTFSGSVPDEDPVVVPFNGLAESVVNLTLTADAGSFPDVAVLLPDRTPLEIAAHKKADKKGRKISVKKLVLPVTGRYFLLVTTRTASPFDLKTVAKPLKKRKELLPVAASGADRVFPAPAGTALTIKIKATKGSVLEPDIVSVTSPAGEPIDLAPAKRKTKTNRDSLSGLPLGTVGAADFFGDYVIRIGIQREEGTGDLGLFQIKAKLPKARKAKLDQAGLLVEPFLDTFSIQSSFDNLTGPGAVATGSFFQKGAVLSLVGYDEETGDPTGVTIEPNLGDPAQSRPSPSRITAGFDFRELTPGTYRVVVTNPDGGSAELATEDLDGDGRPDPAFRLRRAPRATDLSPILIFDGPLYNRCPMRITGDSFLHPGVELEIEPVDPEAVRPPGVDHTFPPTGTDTTIDFFVNADDRDLGFYRVRVTNPDGGGISDPEVQQLDFEVGRAPRVLSIDTVFSFDNETKPGVVLTGGYLLGTPEVVLVHQTLPDTVIEATSEQFVSDTTMTFDLDLVGVPRGTYLLRVTNPYRKPSDPDRGKDELRDAFTVSAAPVVASVDPARGFTGEVHSPFTVGGADFQSGADLRLVDGSTTVLPSSVVVSDAGTIVSDLDLTGAAHGEYETVVTNTDGGRTVEHVPFHVLGRFGLVQASAVAREPQVVANPDRDEHLVVYTRVVGGDTDIRALRISAETGQPLGDEIEITKTSGTPETQPHAAYDPVVGRYLVVYRSGDASIRGREVTDLGGLPGSELVLSDVSGDALGPRVVFNEEEREFFAVYQHDTGSWDVEAIRLPATGALDDDDADVFQVMRGSEDEMEPDVAHDALEDVYVIVLATDVAEPDPDLPDTHFDILAVQVPVDSTTFNYQSLLFIGADTTDDRRPRLARYPDATDPELLVVWEAHTGSGDTRANATDVMARRYDAERSGVLMAGAVRVESTADYDAERPSVVWDPGSSLYRIVYAVAPRMILQTTMPWDQGSKADRVLFLGGETDTVDAPVLAPRGGGDDEVLGVYTVNGNAEGMFQR